MKSDSDLEIYNSSIVRFSTYILLFPFGLTIYPLLVKGSPPEIVIFFLGFILIFSLIILNNKKPFITVTNKAISIKTSYRHFNEMIPFSSLTGYKTKGGNRIVIYLFNENNTRKKIPIPLLLDRNDRGLLISILNERNIYEQ